MITFLCIYGAISLLIWCLLNYWYAYSGSSERTIYLCASLFWPLTILFELLLLWRKYK